MHMLRRSTDDRDRDAFSPQLSRRRFPTPVLRVVASRRMRPSWAILGGEYRWARPTRLGVTGKPTLLNRRTMPGDEADCGNAGFSGSSSMASPTDIVSGTRMTPPRNEVGEMPGHRDRIM